MPIEYPSVPMPQMMNMQMGAGAGGAKPQTSQDMGMALLKAALAQQQKNPAQPQMGQVMPGGATNIMPQQQPVGLLAKLLGGMGGGGAGAAGAAGGVTGGLGGLY